MSQLATRYKSNPYVQRDPNQTLTIMRKAFANNISQTVNGVSELRRYIASVSAYISSDKLTLEDQCLLSVNKNAIINLLEENGWSHRCCTSKDFGPANVFTEGRGIAPTKTTVVMQSLGSSSISSPKTIAQLMTQRSTLSAAQNALPSRDYLGHIILSNAPKTTNAVSGAKFMGARAFENCTRLTSVRMSSDNTWNAFFSEACFKSCSNLTTISTVTNSNSSMSANVGVAPPAGTITVSVGSKTINGNGTFFLSDTKLFPGCMIFTGSDMRETAIYIGTVASIQSNTELTLVLPSNIAYLYSGTFRIANEAMIAVHAKNIGKEVLRFTNVRTITFESHLYPNAAASNSELVTIGTNFCTDCANLTTLNFSVKQNLALTLIGSEPDVIPAATTLNVLTSDGWSPTAAQTQLAALLKVDITRFTSVPKFTAIMRTDPTVLDANNVPMRIATITGLAYHDSPIYLRNLVIPEYVTGPDGNLYQVYDINYPYVDSVEPITNGTNKVVGAFSKSNPSFASLGGLSGTLTIPKTLRYVGDYSFAEQASLSGNLLFACPKLTRIGDKCLFNSYKDLFKKSLTIIAVGFVQLGVSSYEGANFSTPITIRPMTAAELAKYSF
jgi:hypothetical protein